ncbi:MAG: macrolide family glycosyltransferase [Actinocatenispora sp.]
MAGATGRHFAFFLFPDFGHLLPTLEIARELRDRGHRVTYVVDEAYAGPVADVGARHVGYQAGRRAFADGSFEDTGDVGIKYLETCIETVLPLARTALANDPPDVLLYDYENFVVARTLAGEWDATSVQFSPYLASNDNFSLRGEMFKFNFDNELVQRTVDILQKFISDQGLDPGVIWSFAREYDERNLVVVFRDFQPSGETFDGRYVFVGPCFPGPEAGGWARPAGAERVALVSMGTETNDRPEVLRGCVDAFVGTDWHAVLTLGRGGPVDEWSTVAPNVEAHEWLSLPEVLTQVDAVICHGGMGTVMRALSAGTPVVAIPQTVEQQLNARQVAELGVGRVLDPATVTADEVRAALESLLADPTVPARLHSIGRSIEAAGGAVRAADTLQEWLPAR